MGSIVTGSAGYVATGLAALAAASLASSPGAHGAGMPDLKVTAATSAPRAAATGSDLSMRAQVTNSGAGAAGGTITALVLSPDRDRNSNDVRLGAGTATPQVLAGGVIEVAISARVGNDVAPGDYYVFICADHGATVTEESEDDNCRASEETVTVTEATSDDLVRRAVTRGSITRTQGLLYRMYAAYSDPRLPDELEGAAPSDDQVATTTSEVLRSWSRLKGRVQRRLDPYFRAPTYAGSAFRSRPSQSRGEMSSLRGQTSCYGNGAELTPSSVAREDHWKKLRTRHFWIWYQTIDTEWATAAQNRATARWAEAVLDTIWAKETRLLGRRPLADTAERCNGGDGRLDLYIIRQRTDTAAVTNAYPPGCQRRPAFLTIAPDYAVTKTLTRDVLAHEFTHMIQFSTPHPKPCDEYRWLEEATANWMVDHVYPADNYEHRFAASYFKRGFYYPLETYFPSGGSWPDAREASLNGYEDYVFLQFVARTYGSGRVGAIWAATESHDSLEAIDSAVPGGLDAVWPAFSAAAWNQPGQVSFQVWDGLSDGIGAGTRPTIHVDLGGTERSRFALERRRVVEHLAFKPTWIAIDDPEVDSVVVKHIGFEGLDYSGDSLDGDDSGHVTAVLVLADGSTRVEDWTDEDPVELCRQRPSEAVEAILITHSNTTFDDRSHRLNFPERGAEVMATHGRCELPETVTVEARGTYETPPFTETWEGTWTLTKDHEGAGVANYTATEGQVHWTVEGTGSPGTCDVDGSAHYAGEATWTDTPYWAATLRGSSSEGLGEPNSYSLDLNPGPYPVGRIVRKECPSGTQLIGWTALNGQPSATTGSDHLAWDGGEGGGHRDYLDLSGERVEWTWTFSVD